MLLKSLGKLLVGAALTWSVAAPANAENLLTTRYNGAQTFTSTGNLVLFSSGSFFQSFFVPTAQTVMLSFSAVCSTSGTTSQYTSIRIIIDSVVVYPTNNADDAFCTVAGATSANLGLATHSLVTSSRVGAGSHTIQVTVTPHNGGISRIDNLTMIVWN